MDAPATPADDASQGYDAIAERYLEVRRPAVGAVTVRAWARELPPGSEILDLGCGSGHPVSTILVEEGHSVWGLDASPRMGRAFRERFPNAPFACEAVETSTFFGRAFDGVVAVGLVFLLAPPAQRAFLLRLGEVVRPGGRLLLTAPRQIGEWDDLLTGRPSVSLGAAAYESALAAGGFALLRTSEDDEGNHAYHAERLATPAARPQR